jgi:hypothetical protein
MNNDMPAEVRFKTNGLSEFELKALAKLINRYDMEGTNVELSEIEASIMVKVMTTDMHRDILSKHRIDGRVFGN